MTKYKHFKDEQGNELILIEMISNEEIKKRAKEKVIRDRNHLDNINKVLNEIKTNKRNKY